MRIQRNVLRGLLEMRTMAVDAFPSEDGSRATGEFTDLSERFIINNPDFDQQYSHLYFMRLNQLRTPVLELAKAKWGNEHNISVMEKILDIPKQQTVCVVGTLYKDMPLKPSILEEISEERSMAVTHTHRDTYAGENDVMILEDTSGRIKLHGLEGVDLSKLTTGMILAVKGRLESSDKSVAVFAVEDICIPGFPQQPACPDLPEDKYVMLASGLRVGSPKLNPAELQLLANFVAGRLDHPTLQALASRVCRVLVAGNLLAAPDELETPTDETDKKAPVKASLRNLQEQQKLTQPLVELDVFLSQLAACVPVDCMPGSSDPANVILPQQPLNPCLFQAAARFSSFGLVSNPYEFSVDGVRLLGDSGQTVADVRKYFVDGANESSVAIMENLLRFRHLAPTAPDTLGCHPFHEEDPFVLNTLPHVYFCGNQNAFESKTIRGDHGQRLTLVSVPKFSDNGEVVLLNLRTLEATSLSLRTPSVDV